MAELDFALGAIVSISLMGISAFLFFQWWRKRKYAYWEKRGVPFVKPKSIPHSKKSFNEIQVEWYQELGPVYGYFEAEKPKISIGEPAILKNILIKDFSSFTGRKPIVTGDEVHDKMLTIARGEDWRRIRNIVSPIFTTGKLKKMMNVFKDRSGVLVKRLRSTADEGKSIDLKSTYGAFTTDVIAGSIFSAKIDSHEDPGNQFVKTARDVFGGGGGKRPTKFRLLSRLLKLFKTDHAAPSRTQFFKDITTQIVEERRKTGQVMNDFLQLLMDSAREISEEKFDSIEKNLSMDELVGQCLIFFLAGYETTSSALSFATHLLALNEDIQDRLRKEVIDVLTEANGELTYDVVQSMKYMDCVINETLRMFPPAILLERFADADYKLETMGITIPRGMGVTIPIYAMHRDPKFFPNPERFDPDRFIMHEKGTRDPYTYMPFGTGPRNCIGMRFALLEMKICLAYVIVNFKIKRCPNTEDELQFQPGASGFLRPKEMLVEMEIKTDAFPIK